MSITIKTGLTEIITKQIETKKTDSKVFFTDSKGVKKVAILPLSVNKKTGQVKTHNTKTGELIQRIQQNAINEATMTLWDNETIADYLAGQPATKASTKATKASTKATK